MEKQEKWELLRKNYIHISFPPRIAQVLLELKETPESAKSLYIYSEACNTGKTIAACQKALAMLQEAYFKKGPIKSVKFVSETEFLTQFQTKGFRESYAYLQEICEAPLLIYDDFCSTRDTAFFQQIVLTLINYRYEYMLPTIYTSNIPPKQLPTVVDVRIASRLVRTIDVALEKRHWKEDCR